MVVPVTKEEASLNNQTSAPMSSSGSPKRLKGVFCTINSPREVKLPSGLVNKLRRYWSWVKIARSALLTHHRLIRSAKLARIRALSGFGELGASLQNADSTIIKKNFWRRRTMGVSSQPSGMGQPATLPWTISALPTAFQSLRKFLGSDFNPSRVLFGAGKSINFTRAKAGFPSSKTVSAGGFSYRQGEAKVKFSKYLKCSIKSKV